MKKLPIVISIFVIFSFFFFFFSPPSFAVCRSPGYNPGLDPDINLDILGWEEIDGYPGLFDFDHPTDPKAPQLSTLIEGNCTLPVSSVNMVSNTGVPPNVPGDYANLVCLSTLAGKPVLVPNSGYDMGGGCEAVVLYATSDSIVLNYTPDDDIEGPGYTVYLNNFQVDSNLLAYYNERHGSGRAEMPCLSGGEKIGVTSGEICVAIRDTGTFMDPRWLEWWRQCPATALELILKLINICLTGPPLACNPSNSGSPDSRPVPCDACNRTDLLTSSCATTFTVNDEVTYRRGEADFWCPEDNSKPWLERGWGGLVTIDPSNTTIPFVGKKGGEDEQKYLADYFEGTDKYYANYSDTTEAINHEGVFRKIAPLQVQDNLKKQMVYRAIQSKAGKILEGAIHDYLVEYGGESALLSEFADNYPPKDPQERGKWEKETMWGRLWATVPMFSREDTPGQIDPYLGSRPKDTFEILNPEAQIEKVPHVARLYEVSQAINRIILPLIQTGSQAQGKVKNIFTKAEENVLGEKTYLAQAGGSLSVDFSVFLSSKGGNQYDLCWSISGYASGGCEFADWGYCIQPYGFCEPQLERHLFSRNPTITCNMGTAHSIPITANPGDTICATLNITKGVCQGSCCDPDPRPSFTQTSCCKIDEKGIPTCGMGPLPEPPSCGLQPPVPVNPCVKPAITDSNPNDDLCCSPINPINIALNATDQFENTDYIPCGVETVCDPETGICKDACQQKRTHAVNRKVGISLVHPYLSEIWDYTTDVFNGFFNIFRPETVPQFIDLDASSSLFYSYTPGSASPPGGDFYFPYLGGIQLAKEWVMTALNPLPGGVPWPVRVPPQKLDYTIDFRNPSITISEATKNFIINTVLASWPNSKIESHWDYVYNEAVSHGWNPAFVIALWIEESGASGVANAYDLGCLGAPPNNLSAQLDCLFSRPYANESFEEFMCMYSEGEHAPCVFKINPHFPGNLKNWYDRLTQ